MEKTPKGTGVGVDDPYAHVDVCDHLTSDGTCRYAFEHPQHDPSFARERRRDDLACPVVADVGPDWDWRDCPHFRSTTSGRECARCGLEERRMAHDDERPLVEEHHLSYADDAARRAADATELETPTDDDSDDSNTDDGGPSHEITVALCRWCHSKVHDSWARITDDANPSAAALAVAEDRRSRELDEAGFAAASERYDPTTGDDGDDGDDEERDGGRGEA
ncbi:hypothetical protein G9C85_12800 [Halorubellus sp. JP-L1]|uniref:DUF7097 family protein n=1 Tax=Halorubellus sp. JP-L1 TaxID=2715753 RepID=UPI00140A762A|nr:hypothetical protein [Halorubellus sp. JP-L1]NHN42498.1 hypothetical protein [Halorubellus sp. JP-L1]